MRLRLPAACVFSFSVISAELLCPPHSLTLINIQFLISIKNGKEKTKKGNQLKNASANSEAKPQARTTAIFYAPT